MAALVHVRVFEEETEGILPVDWRDKFGNQMMKCLGANDDLCFTYSDIQPRNDAPQIAGDCGDLGGGDLVESQAADLFDSLLLREEAGLERLEIYHSRA